MTASGLRVTDGSPDATTVDALLADLKCLTEAASATGTLGSVPLRCIDIWQLRRHGVDKLP